MPITPRRRQFLLKILVLFRKTGLPVHYTAVGKALGVSKWTAYDMLKELEKEGFLESEYCVSHREKLPGRSAVVFRPTARAWEQQETVSPVMARDPVPDDWHTLTERLLQLFDRAKTIGLKKLVEELQEEMSGIERPVTLGAYTIILFIAHLQELGSRGLSAIQHALHLAPKPELRLSLFAGTVIGSTARNVRDSVTAHILPYIQRFEQYIADCNPRERKLLAVFLNQALERAR